MLEVLIQPIMLFVAWCVLATVNFLIGWPQMRDGNGTLKRLIGVSGALAGLQVLPVAAFQMGWGLIGEDPQTIDEDTLFPRILVLFLVWMFSLLITLTSLRMPRRYGPYAGKPSLLSDPELLSQIARIANALRIPAPVVYRLDGIGPEPEIMAWVGGLAAPSIMITDGVILRLTSQERDAILAHEMGHLSNHTFWWYFTVWSLCGAATVVFAFTFPPVLALPVGWACFTGVKNTLSRYFEYDSDLRAARAVGFTAMVTSLEKTHAVLPIEDRGWRSFLAYSTATHPSLEERRTALWKEAPEGDRPPRNWSVRTAELRRWGGFTAFCIWFGIIVDLLLTSSRTGAVVPNLLLSVIIALAPFIFIRLAMKRDYLQSIQRQRPKRTPVRLALGWLALIVILTIAIGFLGGAGENRTVPLSQVEVFSLVLLLLVLLSMIPIGVWILFRIIRAGHTGYPRILSLIQNHQWADCVTYYEQRAQKFRKDPATRRSVALAHWALGNHEQAEQEFSDLRNDFPDSIPVSVAGALIAIERNDFETGLHLAQGLQATAKKDLSVHQLAARCQLLLGDLENVRNSLREITRISPHSPWGPILRMQLALQQNDVSWPEVLDHLLEVERTSPGSALAYLLRAEYEWRTGSPEPAREARQKFEMILKTTPFVFLGPEYRSLQRLMIQ